MNFIEFKEQPKGNHEFFFTYDAKKDKALLGSNRQSPPIVCLKDEKRSDGVIKIACVEHEMPHNSVYRLHRHQLVDVKSNELNETCYCDSFGVAIYEFKTSNYNSNNEIYIELKNLTIRRINENKFKNMVQKWNNCKLKSKCFDPFGIGFGEFIKKKIDLNCVRLVCQAFFNDNRTSKAILSDRIHNCKSEIKVHQWDSKTEAKLSGGDKFYLFLSELKTRTLREISAMFLDENGQEFMKVKPDYIHCNRAIRLTVPPYPLHGKIKTKSLEMKKRISCKFYLASDNQSYKSDLLKFDYLPECSSCLNLSTNELLCSNKTELENQDFQEKIYTNENLRLECTENLETILDPNNPESLQMDTNEFNFVDFDINHTMLNFLEIPSVDEI
jgi:hypothetical protein